MYFLISNWFFLYSVFLFSFCLLLFHLFLFFFIDYIPFFSPLRILLTHILKTSLAFTLISCSLEWIHFPIVDCAGYIPFFLSLFFLAIVFLPRVLEFGTVGLSWVGGLFCASCILYLYIYLSGILHLTFPGPLESPSQTTPQWQLRA